MDLPLLPKQKKIYAWPGCRTFRWAQFTGYECIGRGSFGEITLGKYKDDIVVVKKPFQLDESGKMGFIKEARLLESLSHKNIVKYIGFCKEPLSMMLHCVKFDMRVFGHDNSVHNLGELLSYLNDQCDFKGFEHFPPKIAKDIAAGLGYLHSQGVAHRDLKPSNVLVGNQHYSALSDAKRKEYWKINPIDCRLTDFGESRSLLIQTNSVAQTRTTRVDRGTPVFMAPELRLPEKMPSSVTIEDLKVADIWSFGMILYTIINPDQKFPYKIELQESRNTRMWEQVINEIQRMQNAPKLSPKYDIMRHNHWQPLTKLMRKCIAFEPTDRPLAVVIDLDLNGKETAPKDHTDNSPDFVRPTAAPPRKRTKKNPNSIDKRPEAISKTGSNWNKTGSSSSGRRIADNNETTSANGIFHSPIPILVKTYSRNEYVKVQDDLECCIVIESENPVMAANGKHSSSNAIASNSNQFDKQNLGRNKRKLVEDVTDNIELVDNQRISSTSNLVSVAKADIFPSSKRSCKNINDGTLPSDVKFLETSVNQPGIFELPDNNEACYSKMGEKSSENTFDESHIRGSLSKREDLDARISLKPGIINFTRHGHTPTMDNASSSSSHAKRSAEPPKYWNGKKHFPILHTNVKSRYTVNDAVTYLTDTTTERCSAVPLRVRCSISFLIDVRNFSDWQDIKCDMNGVYSNVKRCGVWTLRITDHNVEILAKKQIPLTRKNEYHLVQNSKGNKANPRFNRSIFMLRGDDGCILNNTCLLQYHIEGKEDDISFAVGKHGNSKYKGDPYFPTSKGVLNKLKSFAPQESSQKIYESLKMDGGGVFKSNNPALLPRSRKQVYMMKSNEKNKVDGVEDLLIYVKHNAEKIVLQHSDVPSDTWILGTMEMCKLVSNFVSDEVLSYPFCVDPTFNLGLFEVTPLVYKHLFLKSKRTGKNPVFLGPTMIHHCKTEDTYKQFASVCVSNCPSLKNAKGFTTDGERALWRAFLSEIPNAVHLRCFKHFESNCTAKLSEIGIRKATEQKKLLQMVFGLKDKEEGILDATDETDLRTRLGSIKEDIDTMERGYLDNPISTLRFWTYLNGQFEMMSSCMIAEARRKAGMPLDDRGKIERSYTNPSESMNNVMKKKKAAFTSGDMKKNLSKLEFTTHVWESIIKDQRDELALAIAGSSEEYELADLAKYLEVAPDDWFEMTEEERTIYVSKFNNLSVRDVLRSKEIIISALSTENVHEFKECSIDVSKFLRNHLDYADDTANLVAKEVTKLLNISSAIQPKPSLSDASSLEYMVATKRFKNSHVLCKVNKNHISCHCGSFKYDNVCKHSIAVADKVGIIGNHLEHIKGKVPQKNSSALVEDEVEFAAAGKKGHRGKRKRFRPSVNKPTDCVSKKEEGRYTYTSVHHNDNPFIVIFLPVPVKQCKSCGVDFCQRQQILPFNIVLEHSEKWEYPIKGDWSDKRVSNKESKRYYHIDYKLCIKPRFPYFTKDYISISPEVMTKLQPSHRKLLKKEFGVFFD